MGKLSRSRNLIILPFFFFIFILKLSSYRVSTMSVSCIQIEREALLKLKASFIDRFNRLTSWEGTDCCNWDGVGCSNISGHIVKLDLRNTNYDEFGYFREPLRTDRFDSSLLELKYLNYLDLSGNDFNYSNIPSFFESMLDLKYLNLSYTRFYPRIPYHLGNLTNLLVLDLNSYGSYYDEVLIVNDVEVEWMSGLSSLQYLDLSGLNFELSWNLLHVLNTLPSLLSLKLRYCKLEETHLSYAYASLNSSLLFPKLQLLDMSDNSFNCPLPRAFQNMTSSLRFLYLSGCGFNSSLPLWFGNFRKLVGMDLSSNSFTSTEIKLASIIKNNCQIQEIDLASNVFLSGDVLGSHENLSTECSNYDLEIINLANNRVSEIPSWLGQLKNLRLLFLSRNSLRGTIPMSLGNLSSIELLDISGNMLNGGIPTSFGDLLNLEYLSLSQNNLDGIIPESLGQLKNLKYLIIFDNSFKGTLSEIHFANLSQLESLSISGNDHLSLEMGHNWIPPFQLTIFRASYIKGFGSIDFPGWLQTQDKISSLDLSNAGISGPIPAWLRGQNLRGLDLSNNQITGPLPESIADQMPFLWVLRISNARLNGSLPRSICRLKNLLLLALPKNRLSGTIPKCLLTLNLTSLDLSSNQLSGVFPSSTRDLSRIEVVKLGNNELEGQPLITLRNNRSLYILDLQGNLFSGHIPSWWGERLENLQILNLRGNKFSGTLPSSLWLLPRIQILILADNKLEGNIPPDLSNFSAKSSPKPLNYFGTICSAEKNPYEVCYEINIFSQVVKSLDLNYSYFKLYSMVNIDLSNNNLAGLIPTDLTAIKGLFGLNLSHNSFCGSIPTEIGKASSLESLDLSFNQLTGQIPNSMSSLNSLGVLKLSHNNFSGRIPREGHLSTFNNASSYDSNPYLCGEPLLVKCADDKWAAESTVDFENQNVDEEDKREKMWLYIIITLGYAVGLWGVIGVLIYNRDFRYAYFQFADEIKDKIYVAIMVNLAKLKRQMNNIDE